MVRRGRFPAKAVTIMLLLAALFANGVVEGGGTPAVKQQLDAKDTRIAQLERQVRNLSPEGGRRADATLEDRVKVLEGRLSSVNVSLMDAQVPPPRTVPFPSMMLTCQNSTRQRI